MGMDVSGLNPEINESITKYPILEKWDAINWGDRDKEEWKKEEDKYWEEHSKFHKANAGVYFRNNCWWWRPLWIYCHQIAPELISEETYTSGTYNDGAGLDAKDAKKLGIKLLVKIEDGSTKGYKEERDLCLEALPDDDCNVCNNNNRGNSKKKDCHACKGKGTQQNWNRHYPFSVDNVKEFAHFCIQSGGFEIW